MTQPDTEDDRTPSAVVDWQATSAPQAARMSGPSRAGSGNVIREVLARSVERLVAHDPGVRSGNDPEDVHQARVAIRRLRSDLRTFLPLVDARWATELRAELVELGGALGAVRDLEVLAERLRAKVSLIDGGDREAAWRLLAILAANRLEARKRLDEVMTSSRYVALVERLDAARRAPQLVTPSDEHDEQELLRKLARRTWRKLRAAVEALPEDPSDTALHAVRIRAKRARYAVEAVAPAFGQPARELARALSDVQDVLGEHQDAIVSAAWLRDAAANADGVVGFAAGELAALEQADAHAARRQWPRAWRAVGKRRLRAWL